MTTKLTPETAKKLVDASVRINQASDALNTQFHIISQALKELNIGIGYDYKIPDSELTLSYARWNEEGWYIIISNGKEQWPISRSPRHMRIQAVDFLPAFIEGLTNEVILSVQEIEGALKRAELMSNGMKK